MALVTATLVALHVAAAKPTPAPSASPPPVAASRAPATATGVVRDAATGDPISGALVQQEGSVTSVFTGIDGTFRLLLDKTGGNKLTISAMGYEDTSLPVGSGTRLAARLQPVSGFMPVAPLAPLVPVGLSPAETAPLNSGIIFTYGLRNNYVSAPGSGGAAGTISGWSNNDFRLGLRFRWKPWLLEADGTHFEQPMDLAGLRKEDNPAFKPSTWQAGARAGVMASLGANVEVAALAAYRWTDTVPNNLGVPYTGSAMDFEQTRHAIGGELLAAFRPGRGRWHFELGGGYYPLVYGFADSPGQPFADGNLIDAHAILGYEVMPGLRVGLGTALERYSDPGMDQGLKLTLGMHYTPGGVPKGNE